MRTLVLLLLVSTCRLQAQTDFSTLTRPDTLKPIGIETIPGFGRYHSSVRTRYSYDGLDVKRAKDVGRYIMASGDTNAIQEFNKYIGGRKAGRWLLATGGTATLIGIILQTSNRPGTNGTFTTQQPVTSTPGVIIYGGTTSGYMNVEDSQRKNAYYGGMTMGILGAFVVGAGLLMQYPGRHVRRAVQYYNKSLRQRGISWQMTPYSTVSHAGIGLVGRF